jgi:hypothetical protein
MANDETELINSRGALALLGAIGISGMVRINCLSKDINENKNNEKARRRTDKSADRDKTTSVAGFVK